ncbi:MAG: lipoyl(octanoyl) transferase LipB [Planctomycetota bacterium]|jgi:lipoate-protein ligase B|nr:lipoyl(octanoyl) transferase LipB [Planctomycetota bacterium]
MTLRPARFLIRRNLPYAEGICLQKSVLSCMADNLELPGCVIIAEHLPAITCGRSGDGGNLLVGLEELAAFGIEYHSAGRGGDVTYHGPGQWTVYPIIRLDWFGRDLHRYLRLMEECAIRFLSAYGVPAGRRPGLTGAWSGRDKAAAVGVAASRWIAWHGFSLNIHPDLIRFTSLMRPCGIEAENGGVTSLDRLTGRRHEMEETLPALKTAICETLGLTVLPGSQDAASRNGGGCAGAQ